MQLQLMSAIQSLEDSLVVFAHIDVLNELSRELWKREDMKVLQCSTGHPWQEGPALFG